VSAFEHFGLACGWLDALTPLGLVPLLSRFWLACGWLDALTPLV